MKSKQKYSITLSIALPLAATFYLNVVAQNQNVILPTQQHRHVLLSAEKDSSTNYETLSGINLYHTGKGTYQLDFSQVLKENAVLSVRNTAKKLVYQKPVSIKENNSTWRYKLGRLKPGIYLVEVVTSDTTYWTKFKIGR